MVSREKSALNLRGSDVNPYLLVCMLPTGEVIQEIFSSEQMMMARDISILAGESLEDVLCEVAAERHALKNQ